MPKAKKPLPDGSVLLTIFNPYGMPSSFSSILAVTGSERDLRLGVGLYSESIPWMIVTETSQKKVFRWLGIMGITISELFAKRTVCEFQSRPESF